MDRPLPMNLVRVFEDLEAMARAAAEEWVSRAERAVALRGRFTVALSGGSTPRSLFRALVGPPFAARAPWEKTLVAFGDERHVPPEHPDSNYRMAREELLSKVPIPEENVLRIEGEREAAEAATRYTRRLQGLLGSAPVFDLLLMGIGTEGHTASLFPHSSALKDSHWVASPWVEQLQAYRITFTPTVINAARTVLFLVAGAEKAPVLAEVLEGPRDPDRLPAQVVQPAAGEVLWWVDRPAASLLRRTGG